MDIFKEILLGMKKDLVEFSKLSKSDIRISNLRTKSQLPTPNSQLCDYALVPKLLWLNCEFPEIQAPNLTKHKLEVQNVK